jgi:hypothetical protein
MRLLILLICLCSCATDYRAMHYQQEAAKAQKICPEYYHYTEPVSPRKSFNTFILIVIPLSIPFILIASHE